MITYFKDKNHNSKRKHKKIKTLTTLSKTFDASVIIAITLSSITLFLTEIGLIAMPISSSLACGVPIGNKVVYEIFINKYNKYKKRYEKDKQTFISFDKLYRKTLQNNLIDKNEYENLCNIFIKTLDQTKNKSFLII